MRDWRRIPKRRSWSWNSKTDFGPGSEGHRKHRWHLDAWTTPLVGYLGLKRWSFQPKLSFKLSMTAETGGTYGIDIRRARWNRVEMEVEIPGLFTHVRFSWPTWEESLADFLADQKLLDQKRTALKLYLMSIDCAKNLSLHDFAASPNTVELIPPKPMWVDGQVSVVKPVLGTHCPLCRTRHGIWPGPLADLLNTRSIRDKREDDLRAEELRREAIAMINKVAHIP